MRKKTRRKRKKLIYWEQFFDLKELEKIVNEKLAEKRVKETQRKIIWTKTMEFLLRYPPTTPWFTIIKNYVIEITEYKIKQKDNNYYAEILGSIIRQAMRMAIENQQVKNEYEVSSLMKDAIFLTTNLRKKPTKEVIDRIKNAQEFEDLAIALTYLNDYIKNFGDTKVNKTLMQLLGCYIKNPHMNMTEIIYELEDIDKTIKTFYSTFFARTFLIPNYRRYGHFHGLLVINEKSELRKKISSTRQIQKLIPKLTYYGIIFKHPKTNEIYIETILDTPLHALQLNSSFYEYEGYSYFINPEYFLPVKPARVLVKHYHFKPGTERLTREMVKTIQSNFIIHYGEISEDAEGNIKMRKKEEEEKIYTEIENEYILPFPWISPIYMFSSANQPIIIISDPVPVENYKEFLKITASVPFYEIVKTEKIWIHRFLLPPDKIRSKDIKQEFIDVIIAKLRKININPLRLKNIRPNMGNKKPPKYPRPSLKNVVNIWWKVIPYQPVHFEEIFTIVKIKQITHRIEEENKLVVKTDQSYYRFIFNPETNLIESIQVLKGKDPEMLIDELTQFLGTEQFSLFIDKVIMDIEKNKVEQVTRWFLDPTLPGGYSVSQTIDWITLLKRPDTTKIWLFRTDKLKMSMQTLNYIIELLFP